jgi:hypothetical protein
MAGGRSRAETTPGDDGVLTSPDPAMPSTSVPAPLRTDKALMRQIADFDESLEAAEDFLDLMRNASRRPPVQKEVAAARKRMATALELTDKRELGKHMIVLLKDAARCADLASAAISKDVEERHVALWTKSRGLLAQALVEVGALEPLALRAPLQKEQADLRSRLDKIEAEPAGLSTVTDLEALLPKIEAFVKRLGGVGAAGGWMRSTYAPLLARVQAAVKRVPAERCRKTLLAELDFVEADTNKALQKADTRAVQARSVPQLQRIEKLAVRIVAASPAIDRELARLAKLASGASTASAKKLKAMVQAKATTWPSGADADAIESALSAFEGELTKLAALLDKPAAKAPAKA